MSTPEMHNALWLAKRRVAAERAGQLMEFNWRKDSLIFGAGTVLRGLNVPIEDAPRNREMSLRGIQSPPLRLSDSTLGLEAYFVLGARYLGKREPGQNPHFFIRELNGQGDYQYTGEDGPYDATLPVSPYGPASTETPAAAEGVTAQLERFEGMLLRVAQAAGVRFDS